MATFLQGLFGEEAIVDNREPLFTFWIPHVDGTFGLFAPDPNAWKLLAITVVQCSFGAIIYKFIVKRRGTTGAYLLGWSVIVPLAIYLPFLFLEVLDLKNKLVKLSASTMMTVICFRCIEAMYDTSPAVVEISLENYIAYYSSVVPFVWDQKAKARKKINGSELMSSFLGFFFFFFAASFMVSFMEHTDYRPFESPVIFDHLELSVDLLSLSHIGNAYFHVVLLYCTLRAGFDLTAFGENLKGAATQKIFDAPFLRTRSLTEFWTQRWNKMIQLVLKGGVFLPAKQFFNPKIAVFFTFAVSGLYHDYVWLCIFYNQKYMYGEDGVCQGCYEHKFGRVTAFFLYVGTAMLLERPLGRLSISCWISKKLPTPVISHLLLLFHLPVVHWYIGDWIEGGYFKDYSIALWHVRQL